MELVLGILFVAVVIWIVRANNKGKAKWTDTILVVFENTTDEVLEHIGLNAFKMSRDINMKNGGNIIATESLMCLNGFIIFMLDRICVIAKNCDAQAYDIRNVASIILQHEFLCLKFYGLYKRTYAVLINAATIKGCIATALDYNSFKEALKFTSKNFGLK